ncbi:MAG: type I glyceraldehyde-3-phosphate dehydrogenase [Proteobacteria bacterium]|nr:MAG: type I glyceraldehyde-3-phosphate dehydrogenase [Pseudomonadota bacterium]
MSYRLAINGYGRIGQSILRVLYAHGYRQDLQVVAINELADLPTICYLTRYDTTHGRFQGEVDLLSESKSGRGRQGLIVNEDEIAVTHIASPADLPWTDQEVDIVLECTGVYHSREHAQWHLEAGARRVLFSQPASIDVDRTIVYGVNQNALQSGDRIVSSASCTTNCIVPVIKVLNDAFGIEQGTITTIHSAMNDQPMIDAYHHTDLRRTRSAMQNMVPVNTGLAKGIERFFPALQNCFTAMAVRVPTINVSAMDLTVNLGKSVNEQQVNDVLKAASRGGLKGILDYTDEPVASSDFKQDRHSGIVDGSQTRVTNGRLVKVFSWFDNEWGFANRMLDVAGYWLDL